MATQTPMRQLPGAYISTPALTSRSDPTRRQLFPNEPPRSGAVASSSQVNSQLQQQSGTELALAPLPLILKAARCINEVLQQDESYPDIDSFCRPGASSEYDLYNSDSAWAPFSRVQMHPIPDRVFEVYNAGHFSTQLGLFAEINHAYACVDNVLLMWNFTQPNPEVIGFEDQPHSIQAVALVPPRPKVFLDSITHVLVVATTTDLILLGVSTTSNPNGSKSIGLYSTKMGLHTPSGNVNFIAGTSTGRIFFGGKGDTDVYELCYQQEEKWFSGRCHKINHSQPGWSSVMPRLPGGIFYTQSNEGLVGIKVDDSRNLLYTLSDKSTIRTYHIEGPDRLTKVIEKEKNHCLRDVAHMISPSPLLTDRMSIVSISPIPAQEASKLHLMALTSTGCRLFLSATSSASYMLGASSNLAPQSMQVQYVKFPPKEPGARDLRRRPSIPGSSESALDVQSRTLQESTLGFRFAPGYFFDFVERPDDRDTHLLFASAPDAGRIKATVPATALKFYEHANWVELAPKTKAIDVGLITQPFSATKQPLGFGNELAVQFDEPACDLAVLTNSGIYVVRRRRFVDNFAIIIRGAVGEEGLEAQVRKFISMYGRVETVSAALAVACGQGIDIRAGTSRVVDQGASERAKSVYITFGGQPTVRESDGSITAESVKLSSRHDALAIYLARLVRVLWRARVIRSRVDPAAAGGVVVTSTIPTTKLTVVQENLERLRNFLNTNKGIIQGLSGPADLQRVASRQEEVALQAEHQALHALQKLMESISEGISFVLMLFDERVADIYLRLDDPSRAQLDMLTYEDLFSQSSGKELAKLLVKAIVNRNIESGSNVETVADALRRRCGSFCSPDDVIVFKAQEQLKRASEQASNPNVARTLLNESQRLFERVAGSLTFVNLGSAVEQYVEMKYFAGAIQLCLVVAREKDRGNQALAWLNENRPANDPRKRLFEERKRCYDIIHEVLLRLDATLGSEAEFIDGKPTLARTKLLEAYGVVNDSDDEVFHFDLYEWYIEQDYTERLLRIDSPHVITFLRRLAGVDVRHAELLCRFYTQRSQYFEAAQVQTSLAKSEFPIGIKDRITLLSRAKGNTGFTTSNGVGMGGAGNGTARQQQQVLNHEITELLEVAHIQDDLLERLQADERIPDQRKVEIEEALDGQILGLTDLYNKYADQASYFDLCLLIFHAADYHQPRVILETWKSLIEATHRENQEKLEKYEEQQRQQQQQQQQQRSQRGQPQRAPSTNAAPPPLPYEAVSMQIQTIAHRTSLDTMVFPIDGLLPVVCEYAVTHGQDESIGADNSWLVLLFLGLGVAPSVVVRVLERIFDTQEAPFTGRRRRLVAEWINTAVEAWLREVERAGGGGGGGAAQLAGIGGGHGQGLGSWVHELMGRVGDDMAGLAAGTRDVGLKGEVEDVARRARALRLAVERALSRGMLGGTMRFV